MFVCGSSGAVKTADLSEVAFPDGAAVHDEQAEAEPRVRKGTFALDFEPFGPPFEPLPDAPQASGISRISGDHPRPSRRCSGSAPPPGSAPTQRLLPT